MHFHIYDNNVLDIKSGGIPPVYSDARMRGKCQTLSALKSKRKEIRLATLASMNDKRDPIKAKKKPG